MSSIEGISLRAYELYYGSLHVYSHQSVHWPIIHSEMIINCCNRLFSLYPWWDTIAHGPTTVISFILRGFTWNTVRFTHNGGKRHPVFTYIYSKTLSLYHWFTYLLFPLPLEFLTLISSMIWNSSVQVFGHQLNFVDILIRISSPS